MNKRPFLALPVFILAMVLSAGAQNIFTEGLKGNIPTVRFSFENPNQRPVAYEISVDATGDGEYLPRDEEAAGSESQRRRFQVSKPTRDRIFDLTENLRRFRGDYEFRKHRVAFTGTKVLTYTEGAEEYSTKFNWSENKDITELATLFQGIAGTLNAEAELQRLRRFDKLGLDAKLKAMEEQAKGGFLKEIGLIAKVLNEIKSDPQVMSMARARAERLLKRGNN
jgi:hypothetical protein